MNKYQRKIHKLVRNQIYLDLDETLNAIVFDKVNAADILDRSAVIWERDYYRFIRKCKRDQYKKKNKLS